MNDLMSFFLLSSNLWLGNTDTDAGYNGSTTDDGYNFVDVDFVIYQHASSLYEWCNK